VDLQNWVAANSGRCPQSYKAKTPLFIPEALFKDLTCLHQASILERRGIQLKLLVKDNVNKNATAEVKSFLLLSYPARQFFCQSE